MGREGIRIWRSFLYRHRAAPVFAGGRFYTTRVLLPENRQISGLCVPIHVPARLRHRKRYETGKPEGGRGRRRGRIVETFSSARTDLDPCRNSRLVFSRFGRLAFRNGGNGFVDRKISEEKGKGERKREREKKNRGTGRIEGIALNIMGASVAPLAKAVVAMQSSKKTLARWLSW